MVGNIGTAPKANKPVLKVKVEDFTHNGHIDWHGFTQAKARNGQVCRVCYKQLMFVKGYPERCHSCKKLDQPGELDHDTFIRCPRCSYYWDPTEGCDHRVLSDGTHTTTCPECSYDFDVETTVSFSFNSPRLKDEALEVNEVEE